MRKQLGKKQAWVTKLEGTIVYLEYPYGTNGIVKEISIDCDSYDVYMLESYDSVVAFAVRDNNHVRRYTLPRSNYSVTTSKHVSCFWATYGLGDCIVQTRCLTYRLGIGKKRAW